MEIIQGTTDFQLNIETALAIGKFDGVHIGHRRLLDEILARRRDGLKACVFTFDPPPSAFFGTTDGKVLTTCEEKQTLFALMGIDILIEFPMNAATAAIPPGIFVHECLAGQLQARFIAAGTDLSFGDRGAGNAELLNRLAPECGYTVRIIEKVRADGREVSSSDVRMLVERGDMPAAEQLLGIPYFVRGRVEHGHHIGHTLGFPTVNILPPAEKLLPPNGVYYSRVRCGEQLYRAISNVGCKPTVGEGERMSVESFLYDFDKDIYGETIDVELLEFKRPEIRFPDLEALKNQLAEDIEAGAHY